MLKSKFECVAASIGRQRHLLRLLGRATTGAAAVHVARSFGCCSLLPNAGAATSTSQHYVY